MHPNFLKNADRWGWFAAGVFGKLISKLFFLRRNSHDTVILRPGGMGDLICAQIAIEELKLPAKDGDILWLIEKRSEPWAKYAKLNYVCYDHGLLRLLLKLGGRYKRVINTEQLFGLSQAVACALMSSKGELLCFNTNRAQRFATREVEYDWDRSPESLEFLKLFSAAFNSPAKPRIARPRMRPGTGPCVVAIAGLQQKSRQLPIKTWERLLRPWLKGRAFLLAAAPQDRAFAQELFKTFESQTLELMSDFNRICEAVAVAEEVFTMDGGMVHVASYFGVPTTAIFTSGRPGKWSPLAPGSQWIGRSDLSCQPCTKFGQTPECTHGHACKEIHFEEHCISP